jgi:hypothetical protein
MLRDAWVAIACVSDSSKGHLTRLFHDQSILVYRSNLQLLTRFGLSFRVKSNLVIAFEFPCSIGFFLAVGRRGITFDKTAVRLQLEGFSNAPSKRKIVGYRSKHHLGIGILFARVHPALVQSLLFDLLRHLCTHSCTLFVVNL